MTEVSADTDRDGRLTSASVKAFSADSFKAVADFHKPTLAAVTSDSAGRFEELRGGYEIKVSQELKFFENDPYKDRTKIEYYISPVRRR